MNTQTDIEDILSKAKINMMMVKDTVFFSTLCLSLETIITTDIQTAATNGYQLLINPDFFLNLSPDERVFVLAHETLHVAYLHTTRIEQRDRRLWNIAADYVINAELKARGFRIWNQALYDRQYEGMSTEEVYNKILKDEPEIDFPFEDLLEPSENELPLPQDILDKLQQEVQAKISRAAMLAEMSQQAGSIPAHIQRQLSELTKPKVNWKALLSKYIHELHAQDYSWAKPNRRYLPTYLPKLSSKRLERIDFAIDTSGSMSTQQFTQCVSEIHSVLRMLQPREIGVYQFDHILQGSDIVKNVKDIVKLPFSGGGGTNPQPAIDEFTKHKAKALFILTDGFFHHYKVTDPKRPVVWVVYDNPTFKAPFGKTIHFKLER